MYYLLFFLPLTLSCRILSLSGGGSYGAFEVGVITKLIDDNKGQWDFITGVSAGSLNAYYLSTIPIEEEKEASKSFKSLWTSINNNDIYSLKFFLNGESVFDTTPLRKTLIKLFSNRKVVRNIQVSATSLSLGEQVVFNETDLKINPIDILMSSSAIPLLFPPIPFQNDFFVDGGLSGNILIDEPIMRCKDKSIEIDVIICGKAMISDNFHTKPSLPVLVERLVQLVVRQVEYYELNERVLANKNLKINLYEMEDKRSFFSMIDFNNAESMFNEGYNNYKLTVFQ